MKPPRLLKNSRLDESNHSLTRFHAQIFGDKSYLMSFPCLFQQAAPFAETEKKVVNMAVKSKEAYFCNNRDTRSNVANALMYEVFSSISLFSPVSFAR
jgi:hypothetical protein